MRPPALFPLRLCVERKDAKTQRRGGADGRSAGRVPTPQPTGAGTGFAPALPGFLAGAGGPPYSALGSGRAGSRFRLHAGGGKSEHHRAGCRVTADQVRKGRDSQVHTGGRGESPRRRIVPQKINRPILPPARDRPAREAAGSRKGWVRVKWRGKSPPLRAQATRQGKPHPVQGQIGDGGAARSIFAARKRSGVSPGYWLLRQMIPSPALYRAAGRVPGGPIQGWEDKIRLTALPGSAPGVSRAASFGGPHGPIGARRARRQPVTRCRATPPRTPRCCWPESSRWGSTARRPGLTGS